MKPMIRVPIALDMDEAELLLKAVARTQTAMTMYPETPMMKKHYEILGNIADRVRSAIREGQALEYALMREVR